MAEYEIDWNDYHKDWEVLQDGHRVDYFDTKQQARQFAKRKGRRGDRLVEYTKNHTFNKEEMLGDDGNWLEVDGNGGRQQGGGLFGTGGGGGLF